MKAKVFLTADGETTGLGKKAILFDFAYVIATRKKDIIERSFLVKETITNPKIMLSALSDEHWKHSFGGKLFHHYIPGLNGGTLKLHKWRNIVETMRDDMRTYGVDVFAAYNLNFDMGALARTQELIYGSQAGKILEYKPDLLCLWNYACDAVCNTKMYHDVARRYGPETGWITPADNVRTNAEKVYAFLTGQFDFIESHTALEDAQIETEILRRLLAKKKVIPYNRIDYMPWRRAQTLYGDFDKQLENTAESW